MIIFIHCRILFRNISLRIFAARFTWLLIGSSLLLICLFNIVIIVASQNELGCVYSPSIFYMILHMLGIIYPINFVFKVPSDKPSPGFLRENNFYCKLYWLAIHNSSL